MQAATGWPAHGFPAVLSFFVARSSVPHPALWVVRVLLALLLPGVLQGVGHLRAGMREGREL